MRGRGNDDSSFLRVPVTEVGWEAVGLEVPYLKTGCSHNKFPGDTYTISYREKLS